MLKKLLVLAFALIPLISFAKNLGSTVTPTSTGFSVKFSKDGVPLAAPMSQSSTGVQVGGSIPIALSTSVSLPVSASAIITGAMMGGPWGAAIAGVGTVALIAIPAMLDAFNRAKLRVTSSGSLQQVSGVAKSPSCPSPPYYNAKESDADVVSTPICVFTAPNSGTLIYGWGYSSSAYGWTAATYPCGDRSCPTAGVSEFVGYVYGAQPAAPAYVDIILVDAVNALTASAPTIAEVQALIDLNFPPVVDQPTLTGPASVSEFNTVRLGLDGTVEEIEKRYIASFSPGHIEIKTQKTTTVKTPSGTTTTLTTNADGSPGGTSVTTRPAASSSVTTETPGTDQPKVCGLPGTPVCAVKVDETGTQDKVKDSEFASKLDIAADSVKTAIDGSSAIQAPKWTFSFQLPTGCAPYQTGIRGFVMNICQFQSTIHDLLSMVWAAVTAFAMIGMVGRTIRES